MHFIKVVLLIFVFNIYFVQSQSLKEYRWKNRIILLVYNEANSESFQKQRESFLEKADALKERDLILIYLNNETVDFNHPDSDAIDGRQLRKQLRIRENFRGVLLIGKDGGVKLRAEYSVEPQQIFDLIDSMPMRRAEMKN